MSSSPDFIPEIKNCHSLSIGITTPSDHKHGKYCDRDALQVNQALANFGFTTNRLINTGQTLYPQIYDWIQTVGQSVTQQVKTLGLLFYSGQGLSQNGEMNLSTSDLNSFVGLTKLLTDLKTYPDVHWIVLINGYSSRGNDDGGDDDGGEAAVDGATNVALRELFDSVPNLFIGFSCGVQSCSLECQDRKMGYFCHALMESLDTKELKIDGEWFDGITKQTTDSTQGKQVPVSTSTILPQLVISSDSLFSTSASSSSGSQNVPSSSKMNMFAPGGDHSFLVDRGEPEGEEHVYSDGTRYKGQMKGNKKHGYGTISWASGENSGSSYTGDWQNDKREGVGRYVWANGSRYMGQWKDNKITGFGELIWGKGNFEYDRYLGMWENGVKHGRGKMFYANGNVYEGDWVRGNMEGFGELNWDRGTSKGDRYVGHWQKGQRHGRGKYFWANGNQYCGDWNQGKMHGQGCFMHPNGAKHEGKFEDNKLVTHGNQPAPKQ